MTPGYCTSGLRSEATLLPPKRYPWNNSTSSKPHLPLHFYKIRFCDIKRYEGFETAYLKAPIGLAQSLQSISYSETKKSVNDTHIINSRSAVVHLVANLTYISRILNCSALTSFFTHGRALAGNKSVKRVNERPPRGMFTQHYPVSIFRREMR